MANVKGKRGVGRGTQTGNMIFEEIVPSSQWTADKNGHYLHVELPGFKKEHVNIEVINSGRIKISGEKPVHESRKLHFEKSQEVPENSNLDKITAKFDGEILYVTVPKRVVDEEKSENISKKENNSGCHGSPHLSFPKDNMKKCEGEANYLERAMEMLRNNKESIVSSILGFSLGVLLTSKFNRVKTL
ncbi:hypothetical protein UlMin_008180 [Ulmus minor]